MSFSHEPVLKEMPDRLSDIWNQQTAKFAHALSGSDLFSDESLVDIICRHPSDLLNISTMDNTGHDLRTWHHGELGKTKDEGIIEAVSKGPIWVNVRNVNEIDPRFKEIEETLFAQLEASIPGLKTYKRKLGLLLSSPKTRVFYHMDIPGQGLMQIRGQKRIYIYPPEDPFLSKESLEDVVLNITEEEIPYNPRFDESAEVYDIGPGDMLAWKLNGPHRIDNHDCLNVSMTIEYWTDEIRRSYAVNYANAALRHLAGIPTRSQATTGPMFWAKFGLAAGVKFSGIAKRKQRKFVVDFQLDAASPSGMSPVGPRVIA